MCGIAGMLRWDQQRACAEQLGEMIAMVRHRGPDSLGLYTDGAVGLAHARLSVIDLENGKQPMQTADGQVVISFNGEIYNYVELRQSLADRGYQFRTTSDTEVILHAYAEYGERCVEHFNGQWAFAIWDRRRQRLFLSRDRLGIRPLFHVQVGSAFLFASEIKALFAHPGVERAIDPQGLNQLFTYWAPLAPVTLFRGIRELPPGHNMVIDGVERKTQPTCYWHFDYDAEPTDRSADAWTEELRQLLTDATRLRLRADVPVGAYLSGGLDSTIIAVLAEQIAGGRLKTFSVTFDDGEFDEADHQRSVVEELGVEHHALHCSYDDIARVFPDVVWHAEKPLFRTAPAPLQLLAEMVHASDLKVVLTGEGADEMLGGYDIFKEAKVRRFCARAPDSASRAVLLDALYPYLPNLRRQSVAMRRAFFQTRSEDIENPYFSHLPRWGMSAPLNRFLVDDYRQQVGKREGYADLATWLPDHFAQWSPFRRAEFLEASILLPGYILSSQGDRMAMAHSVEGRFPFLDHRIAELAVTIPPRLKMRGINEKHLLKRAFADAIPQRILRRTKQPYRAPDAKSFFARDWQSARADYVDELLSPECVERMGIFRPQAVAKLLRKLRNGGAIGTRDNMAVVVILSTQLLADQFIERFPSVREREQNRVPLDLFENIPCYHEPVVS